MAAPIKTDEKQGYKPVYVVTYTSDLFEIEQPIQKAFGTHNRAKCWVDDREDSDVGTYNIIKLDIE